MPLLIEPPEQEFDLSPAQPYVRLLVRNPPGVGRSVEVIRVVLDDALALALQPCDQYPLQVGSGKECELVFRARTELHDVVEGELQLHVAEDDLTAVRPVRLSLFPDRPFDGVFAVDFGSSRLAAAFIDPSAGSDQPRMVEFAPGQLAVESTFAADFARDPPRWSDLASVLDEPLGLRLPNVFFRPRQFLVRSRSRPIVLPNGGSKHVEESHCPAWVLTELIRRIGRSPRPGRPNRLSVPLPASLTPSQADSFRRLAEETPALRGRLNPGGTPAQMDEASAVAFYWVWENAAELAAVCAREGGPSTLRLLVVDAGASSVDASLLEMDLSAGVNGRLTVAPRLLARDGFPWLAGDRVTAMVFRRLKQQVAEPRAPGAAAADAEEVLPTRTAGQYGGRQAVRQRNFLALWRAAEALKHELAEAGDGAVRRIVDGLETVGGERLPAVLVSLSAAQVSEDVADDARKALLRLIILMTADNAGGRVWPDRLILTGAAALLPAFRTQLIEQFESWRQGAGDGSPATMVLTEWERLGKQAVAKGAALATYYREYAPAVAASDAASRLVLLLNDFQSRLPFTLLVLRGGPYEPIFPRGTPFVRRDGSIQPCRKTVSWQQVFPFFRFGGAGKFDLASDRDNCQPLGHVRLPDRTPASPDQVEVVVLPDYQIEVWAGEQRFPLQEAEHESTREPLNEPFSGYL